MGEDLYSVLAIEPETDKQAIRKAYLKLAREYHPDVNKYPNAKDQFDAISKAYLILYDDESRFIYNLYFKDTQEISCRQQPCYWWKQYEPAVSIMMLALETSMWVAILVWIVAQLWTSR